VWQDCRDHSTQCKQSGVPRSGQTRAGGREDTHPPHTRGDPGKCCGKQWGCVSVNREGQELGRGPQCGVPPPDLPEHKLSLFIRKTRLAGGLQGSLWPLLPENLMGNQLKKGERIIKDDRSLTLNLAREGAQELCTGARSWWLTWP
jgi:hypothetical protein